MDGVENLPMRVAEGVFASDQRPVPRSIPPSEAITMRPRFGSLEFILLHLFAVS
jgi:hypothetical protein